MNKIIITTDGTCNCCNNSDTILRIVAGNDFTLRLTLTYKEDGEVKAYDLSDAEDLVVNAVTPNGERIELDSHVSGNHIIAYVESLTFAQYVPYGIEILWIDVPENNKRAAAPNLFSFVNTSAEANDAEDVIVSGPYDYNLEILSDVAYVNIGEIPTVDMDDYYTKDEVDTKLDDYVQTSDLSDYATEDYVDTAISNIPQPDLSDYVTNSSLNTTLEDYATEDYVDTAISNIPTTDLTNYYTKSEIDEQNISYVSNAAQLPLWRTSSVGTGWSQNHYLENNEGTTIARLEIPQIAISNSGTSANPNYSSNILSGLIGNTDLIKVYQNTDAINNINTNLQQNYVTNTSLNTTLADYAETSDLADYVTNTSLNTTLADYAQTSDLADYVTNTALSTTLADYAETSDLADYVTNTSLNTTLADYAQTSDLADYVTQTSLSTTLNDYTTTSALNTALTPINNSITSIQSDITSLDGRVTTLEQSGGGGTVPSNVVVSDDADEIVLLTQAEYDALVNNNQVEQDVLYYITDATSDYVTNSSLNTTLADYAQTSDLSDYATTQYVDSEISQIDLSDYATTQYVDDAVANSGHVSSTTITTITQLTQSEYDDLVNNNQIDSTTLYVIVEDGGSSSHTYEILEEIHATGYPTYIDTGVYTSSDISFEVLFKCIPDHTIENDRIIAGSTSWSDWQTMAFDYEGDPCLKCKFIGDTSWTTFSSITPDNNTHKLYLSSTEFKFDDTTLDTRSQSQYSTTNSQIRIAQSDMYQPAGEQGYYYYYYVKIWDGNTLIRNYVPAKRLSDDTYGFYDMENDTFNPSIGSSDFTGTSKSTPEYIDE